MKHNNNNNKQFHSIANQEKQQQEQQQGPTSPNYLSCAVERAQDTLKPATSAFLALSYNKRVTVLAVLAFLFFWPLLILAFVLPWAVAGGAVAYGVTFGFPKLLADLQEVSQKNFGFNLESRLASAQNQYSNVSGKVSEFVKNNATARQAKEYALIAYKSVVLVVMAAADFAVAKLLCLARSVNNFTQGRTTCASASCEKKCSSNKTEVTAAAEGIKA